MVTQLRIELMKLARSKAFLLALASIAAFVVLMLWGFYSYAKDKTGGKVEFKYTYESSSYFNGLTFALYSSVFAFSLLIPIFIAMTAGSQIAGEARAGTLRMLLTRPTPRVTILLSKFLATVFYTLGVMVFFIGLNLLAGLIFIGWGNLELYPGPLNLVEEPGHLFRNEALLRFVASVLTSTWALTVVASLAFLLSVIFDNPVTSVVSTVAIYIIFHVVGRIEFFEHLRPYFFTTDMDFWRDIFKPDVPWTSMLHYASRCGIYIVALLLLSVILFERKDITS